MQRFKYEITKHPAEAFNDLVYYCTEAGECSLDHVPDEQTRILQSILNERGGEGWEMIQVSFGRDGLIAFWKRSLEGKKLTGVRGRPHLSMAGPSRTGYE